MSFTSNGITGAKRSSVACNCVRVLMLHGRGGNGVLNMWVFWLRAKEIEEPRTVRNNCGLAGRVMWAQ